jgi:hypothetical protein
MLDWQEEELSGSGGDARRRESMKMAAWIKPKTAHRKLVTRLLQVRAHVILCFRAEEKIEITKDERRHDRRRPEAVARRARRVDPDHREEPAVRADRRAC